MVSSTETQTGPDWGRINGIDVGLTATLPAFATDTFGVGADITTGSSTQDINVALVLDPSGSTRGSSGSDVDGDGANDTFLDAEKLVAKQVFQSLVDAGYAPESVTIKPIEYSSDGNTFWPFNLNDQAAFVSAVNSLMPGGGTNVEQASTRSWTNDAPRRPTAPQTIASTAT